MTHNEVLKSDNFTGSSTNDTKQNSEGLESEHEMTSIKASKASKAPHTLLPDNLLYRCYHKDCIFETEDEIAYRRYATQNHVKYPLLYPSKAEVEKYGLTPQGKDWENK